MSIIVAPFTVGRPGHAGRRAAAAAGPDRPARHGPPGQDSRCSAPRVRPSTRDRDWLDGFAGGPRGTHSWAVPVVVWLPSCALASSAELRASSAELRAFGAPAAPVVDITRFCRRKSEWADSVDSVTVVGSSTFLTHVSTGRSV